MRIIRTHTSTLVLIGIISSLVGLNHSGSIVQAWRLNRVRLGVPPSLTAEAFAPAADCRMVLAGLDQGMVGAAATLENSPCLVEDTAFSDLIRLRLGELHAAQGDLGHARRLWQNGDQLGTYFLYRTANLTQQGKLSEALVALANVEGWSGYLSTELHLRGAIAWGQRDQEGALDAWRQALVLNAYQPALSVKINRSATAYELGKAAVDTQKWPVARDAFSLVVALDPHNPFGWMRLGLVYLNGFGDIAQAEHALRTSLENGDVDWAHYGLGRVLEAQGRDVEAIDEMFIAFRMSRYRGFRDGLLSLLDNTAHRQAALATYSKMLLVAPNDPQILVANARVADEAGELTNAIDLYKRALAIEIQESWRRSLQELTEKLSTQ